MPQHLGAAIGGGRQLGHRRADRVVSQAQQLADDLLPGVVEQYSGPASRHVAMNIAEPLTGVLRASRSSRTQARRTSCAAAPSLLSASTFRRSSRFASTRASERSPEHHRGARRSSPIGGHRRSCTRADCGMLAIAYSSIMNANRQEKPSWNRTKCTLKSVGAQENIGVLC
jgi:hypothetical protein